MVSLSLFRGFSGLAVLLGLIMAFKEKKKKRERKKDYNGDLVKELPTEETIRILIGISLVIPKRVFERLKQRSSFSSEVHCCKYSRRFLGESKVLV